MDAIRQIVGAVPRVIFRVSALLSTVVGLFWIWFWFTTEWKYWRELEVETAVPGLSILLLASGWFLLALLLAWLQHRFNRSAE